MPVSEKAETRFFRKTTENEDGCWIWNGYINPAGYGQFGTGEGKTLALAHRWCWEFFNGPIPDGLHLDHLCRVRACVNPFHLDPVIQRVNNQRANAIRVYPGPKAVCVNGHPQIPANLHERSDRPGKFYCKPCHVGWSMDYYYRHGGGRR